MKRMIGLTLALILALSLAACGSQPAKTESTGSGVQLANPYGTYDTQEAMMEAAGLEVRLPEALPQWVTETVYRAIPGELVEVIYTDGGNEIRVRIKNGSEDISGVYDADTKEQQDVTVGENTVHLKGETQEDGDFLVFVSTWNTLDGRTYSVTSPEGISLEELLPLLSEIQ